MGNCPLCNAIDNEQDEILYQDNNIVILPTKSMKGHNKRIMAILVDHVKKVDGLCELVYENTFIEFCQEYFNEEPTFALVDSTYASIKDHWHRIACDWKSVEDIQQLLYTPHRSIQTNKKWSPK